MDQFTATIAYTALIAGLFVLDRDRSVRTSPALWLSILWLSISASRPVSSWFGVDVPEREVQYMDGSPVDRFVFMVLVFLGICVVLCRWRQVSVILSANVPIVVFVLYCGVSVVWSDYWDVSFKRWIKLVGTLTMVLIVQTDPNPMSAVKRLFTRVSFLLVPTSLLLIKYYPDLGRGYNRFTWTTYYRGVATAKNELGIVCLISGIGVVWRVLQVWREKRGARNRKMLIGQFILLAMVTWLLWLSNSMTSVSCFLMATILMVASSLGTVARQRWTLHLLVVLIISVTVSTLFLNMGADAVASMGRDPTLTGRSEVWNSVLAMAHSPLLGTGYESFWLGPRLERLWSIHWWHPNEAHDGYIELYLNLGWIGILLFSMIPIAGYRKAIVALRRNAEEARLRVALICICLIYNCTESAVVSMHPIWIMLLLAATYAPDGWVAARSADHSKKAITVDTWGSENILVTPSESF